MICSFPLSRVPLYSQSVRAELESKPEGYTLHDVHKMSRGTSIEPHSAEINQPSNNLLYLCNENSYFVHIIIFSRGRGKRAYVKNRNFPGERDKAYTYREELYLSHGI